MWGKVWEGVSFVWGDVRPLKALRAACRDYVPGAALRLVKGEE